MYVYWRSEPSLWTVGFLAPGGAGPNRDRHPESDHDSREKAAARVAYLNGGTSAGDAPNPTQLPLYDAMLSRAEQAEAERDKLRAFKDWVHAYLDGKGVPHHPPGPHGAEGCRIGDRMDWLMAERDRLRAACEAALHRLVSDGYEPQHYGGEVLPQLRAALEPFEEPS